MDLISVGHKEKIEYFASTKMWKQTIKHEKDQSSLICNGKIGGQEHLNKR